MWVDATVYCGIAQVRTDDSAALTNLNNTRSGYARVDSGCWGRSDHLSELHELFHTLGSVQPTAPHGTAGFHCIDEYDAMCYRDATSVTLTYPCANANERLLDCGNDDYFHVNPPAGSYLDTHWNTADSAYLSSAPLSGAPAPTADADDRAHAGSDPDTYPRSDPSADARTDAGTHPSPDSGPHPGADSCTDTHADTYADPRSDGHAPAGSHHRDRHVLRIDHRQEAQGPLQRHHGGRPDVCGPVVRHHRQDQDRAQPSAAVVLDPTGATVLSGSGPSVLKAAATLPAGTYVFEVSGSTVVLHAEGDPPGPVARPATTQRSASEAGPPGRPPSLRLGLSRAADVGPGARRCARR